MAVVALIGTLDTKGAECAWLAEQLDKHGVQALFVDVGSFSASPLANVSSDDVIAAADSDAVARWLLSTTPAEHLGIGAVSLNEVFTALTSDGSDGAAPSAP